MATFKYKARTKAGVIIEKQDEAQSKLHLKMRLKKEDILPITITEVIPPRPKDKKIKGQELIDFTTILMFNLEGGFNLSQILHMTAEETDNKYLKELLPSMARDIDAGEKFGEVCAKYPTAFPKIYASIVRSGEKSGELVSMLKYLVKYLKWDMGVKRQIKGMMIYPVSVMTVAAIVSVILLVGVFPVFLGIIDTSKTKIPPLSAFMISISNFLQAYWYYCLFFIVGGFTGFKQALKRSPGFKAAYERALINLPIFGKTYRKILVSRVANNLVLMLRAGLPIIATLGEVKETVGNKVYADGIEFVKEETLSGNPIAGAFKATEQYPSIFNNMLKVGESTGNIDDAMTKVTEYYDEDIPASVDTLMKTIEPILLVGILIVVGTIILSFVMLMYTSLGSIG